eukprot:9379341-Ditylum_brightwellii.AAC.1
MFIMQQEEDVMAGATILIVFIIIVHQQVGVMAERTLNTSGAYKSFGPGGNGGGFQHHGRGGNRVGSIIMVEVIMQITVIYLIINK